MSYTVDMTFVQEKSVKRWKEKYKTNLNFIILYIYIYFNLITPTRARLQEMMGKKLHQPGWGKGGLQQPEQTVDWVRIARGIGNRMGWGQGWGWGWGNKTSKTVLFLYFLLPGTTYFSSLHRHSIFSLRIAAFLELRSRENCSLLGTDDFRGQISVFAPNKGSCLHMMISGIQYPPKQAKVLSAFYCHSEHVRRYQENMPCSYLN